MASSIPNWPGKSGERPGARFIVLQLQLSSGTHWAESAPWGSVTYLSKLGLFVSFFLNVSQVHGQQR